MITHVCSSHVCQYAMNDHGRVVCWICGMELEDVDIIGAEQASQRKRL